MFVWLDKLWRAIVWLAQQIVDYFLTFMQYLADWLYYVIQVFEKACQTVAKECIDAITAAFPAAQGLDFSRLFWYIDIVNSWVALDVGALLLGLYMTFWVAFVTARLIKSFVPTISG